MKSYYRIILGKKNSFAKEAYEGGYVGAGWLPDLNLTSKIPDKWKDFNKKYIPVYLKKHTDKSKVTAGLACGMLHTIIKGMKEGDIVLSPDGNGNYYAGEVSGEYQYHKGANLPHQRPVRWFSQLISREDMSESLRNSTGSIGTVSEISKYQKELDSLLAGNHPHSIVAVDEAIEDPSVFALEQHLEDFLVKNWKHTELGKDYDIYEEDGEIVGKQFPSDTGPIDVLAISKNKKELLVVELKKGRASDVVVGQIQRYMGYVQDELAEKNQKVRGVIIAFEDDQKIRRALSVAKGIDFYTYKIKFKLFKA